MKGTIEKINDNWMVILDQRTWQDPSAEDLILPLHIDDLWVIDHTSYILGEKQELNFQILTVEEGVTPCGTHIIYKDYAKLILKENHIVDTNEMVDQVPDVRKMVEDDNYLTPVDWLMDRIKWIHRETYDYLIKEGQYDRAKRMESSTSSQTEISDEEIEKGAEEWYGKKGLLRPYQIEKMAWISAIKWYKEQIKNIR